MAKRVLLTVIVLLAMGTPARAQVRDASTLRLTGGPCDVKAGAGNPEGAVTGKPCDVFISTNGTVYKKDLGSGNDTTGWSALATGGAAGDASTNTSSSIDSEVALFSSTTGKLLKRATGTGVAHLTSGVLSVGTVTFAEGGTGLTSASDDTTLISNGSAWQAKALADCDDTAGQHLNYDTATNAWSCGSSIGSGITASSSDTLTNKTIDAEGTGNAITLPFTLNFVIGLCQNTTASLGLSLPASNPAVVACVTGTNTQLAVAQFADSANLSMQAHFSLPADWTGAIDVRGKWRTSATSGDVVWQVATICVADAETLDPSFNTASTTTETAKGTTLQLNDWAITGVTATGCAAGEELFFKVFRDSSNGSDTLAATAELVSLTFTIRRTM